MVVSPGNTLLIRQSELLESRADLPVWFVDAYAQFRSIVLDEQRLYPCYFGVDGERDAQNWYTYVETGVGEGQADSEQTTPNPGIGSQVSGAGVEGRASNEQTAPNPRSSLPVPGGSIDRLAETLAQFLGLSAQLPGRLSLLAFFGPPRANGTLEEYAGQFWQTLALLRQCDRRPWPAAVPTDPNDPKWEFCFAGEPLFLFGNCSAYRARRSRNLGDCLVVVFQSKRVFHGIGGETPAGRAAKNRIRQRLRAYDDIPPHAILGPSDHSSIDKWKQYFLPDDDRPIGDVCPLTTLMAAEQLS